MSGDLYDDLRSRFNRCTFDEPPVPVYAAIQEHLVDDSVGALWAEKIDDPEGRSTTWRIVILTAKAFVVYVECSADYADWALDSHRQQHRQVLARAWPVSSMTRLDLVELTPQNGPIGRADWVASWTLRLPDEVVRVPQVGLVSTRAEEALVELIRSIRAAWAGSLT